MIGFIGCGNMASAIIKGMCECSFSKSSDIGVFDIDQNKTAELSEIYGIKTFTCVNELIKSSTTVVLAVKPNIIPSLLNENTDLFKAGDPLIISIAAGKSTEEISSYLNYVPRLSRIMPNINAMVQSAVSAFCFNERVTEDDEAFVQSFCDSFGKGIKLEEKLFSIYSAIGGCSPAFVYMFIDSMARAAVKNGMTKQQALEVSAQAVLGSAKMILSSEEHPWQLVDRVCSPGGTTIEGVAALQENGFEASVISAVEASFNKDKKM